MHQFPFAVYNLRHGEEVGGGRMGGGGGGGGNMGK